jgi:hypothetical protein
MASDQMASDQSVGTKNEKNEEGQADYQQFKNVEEGVDKFAHGALNFQA